MSHSIHGETDLEAFRVGIRCDCPDQLRARLMVSPMRILPRVDAVPLGFVDSDVIVPTHPRAPSHEEAEAIVATSETTYAFELTTLPAVIGQRALALNSGKGFEHPLVRDEACLDLDQGFRAVPFGYRLDKPGQMNVSVDSEGMLVGDHIDSLDPRQTLTILNMGPGARWHRFVPGFLREDTDSTLGHRPARLAHMRKLLKGNRRSSILAYWIRLEPPSGDATLGVGTVDALVRLPAARCLHDGATYDCKEPSTVVFVGMSID